MLVSPDIVQHCLGRPGELHQKEGNGSAKICSLKMQVVLCDFHQGHANFLLLAFGTVPVPGVHTRLTKSE